VIPTNEERDGIPKGSLAAIILLVPANAYSAFIVYKLYGWFAVPIGAPILGWAHIWGLVILLEVLTLRPAPASGKPPLTLLLIGIGTVTIMFLTGWLAHGLMTL